MLMPEGLSLEVIKTAHIGLRCLAVWQEYLDIRSGLNLAYHGKPEPLLSLQLFQLLLMAGWDGKA